MGVEHAPDHARGKFDTTVAVSIYLFIWVGASLIATLMLKDRTGADLYPSEGNDGNAAGGLGEPAGPDHLG
ncbi:hypothetical protein [Glutamicibacter sp. MCAF14]|uniref:hypothetical protein n=1 Tax=Glutamicibacter sp. MCAF14 TaxID=3233043 RepID=UPI003F8DA374